MSSNTVDSILQRLIADAKNLNPDIDVAQGSETYIRFIATASAIWGAYKHLDWTLDQIFPTTMGQASLETYAANRGLSIGIMTPAELLAYIVSRLRKPPSGGKARDFERWAMETVSTGRAFALQASMLSSSTASFSGVDLVAPHDDGIGLHLDESDVDTVVLSIDLGSAQSLFGLGLGTHSSRTGVLEISSTDDPGSTWTVRGSVTAGYWWRIADFDAAVARYWRLRLLSLSDLSIYAKPEWHKLTLYGLECYTAISSTEQASSAKALMNYNGVGTLLTLLQPSGLSMRLCEAVRVRQETEGPVAPKDLFVSVPSVSNLAIRVVITGKLTSTSAFKTAVAQYVAGLGSGALFVSAQIVAYAMQHGASYAVPFISVNGGAEQEYPATIQAGSTELFNLASLEVA